MAAGADALVLNTGTATTTDVDTMVDAGRRANEADIPVVLDSVGYGIAGERAADSNPAGPASYRRAFIDAVAALANQSPAAAVETRITDR